MRITICLKILIAVFAFSQLQGQNVVYEQDHLGLADGLSGQLIKGLTKDKKGNLWILTNDNLNKYDGYSNTIINSKNSVFKPLPFLNVLSDAQGNIWVGQAISSKLSGQAPSHYSPRHESHYFIIHRETEEIIPINDFFKDGPFLREDIDIIEKRQNTLYIALEDGRIYCYKEKLEFCFTVENMYRFVGIGKKENYFEFNENSNTLYEKDFNHKILNERPLSDFDKKYSKLAIGKSGNLIYLKDSKIYGSFNIYKDGQFEGLGEFVQNPDNPTSGQLFSNEFRYEEKKDGSSNFFFNKQFHQNLSKKDWHTTEDVPFRYVTDFFGDEYNTTYLATNLGIYIFKPQPNYFNTFLTDESGGNSVRSIYHSEDLIIAKTVNGQHWSSPDGSFDLSFTNSRYLSNAVIDIYRDPKNPNWIWQCGWMASPLLIDLEDKKVHCADKMFVGVLTSFFRSPYSDRLYCLGDDKITYNHTHPKGWEIIEFPIENSSDTLKESNFITAWNDQLLLGTDDGLMILDEEKDKARRFWSNDPSNPFKIRFIHKDKTQADILWLGSKFNGIIKLNTETMEYENYHTDSGLSNDNIHAILEDNQERLWISTNKYLNCLSKDLTTNYLFTESEGISNNEFNKWSHYVDIKTNNFFFGGLNGYTYFNPDSIEEQNNPSPQLLIPLVEKLRKDGKSIVAQNITENKTSFRFDESDLSIQISLNVNQILNNHSNQFEYRIPNIEDQWKSISGNLLTLGKLPYGTYDIEFIANRNKRIASSDIKSIAIEYYKPFYKTVWFFITSLLLFGLLIWLLVRIQTNAISKQNIILEELVEKRTSELNTSNQTKDKLFAILAHDLRNPISSLSNITNKIKFLLKKNRIDELNILADHTQNKVQVLNNSLNNILQWALVSTKKINISYEPVSLLIEMEQILLLYDNDLKEKEIKVNIDLEDKDIVKTDRHILQIIMRNIISNSIKYSTRNAIIDVTFSNNSSGGKKVLYIRDYGIGYDCEGEKLDHHRTKYEIHGSGIGLVIVKELSDELDVDFKIYQHSEGGTQAELAFSQEP